MSKEKTPPKTPPSKPAPQQKRVTIDMPKDLEAVYANVAFISHTPAEIIFDLAQVLPRTNRGKVVSRIIMSPMHAKLLHRALGQNIANFEQQYGPIRFPRTLADELFKFPPPEEN